MTTIINPKQDTSNIISLFKKNDAEIKELLDLMVNDTDNFTTTQVNDQSLKQALSLEFKLLRLRTLVNAESTLIKSILSLEETKSPTILAALKRREAYLVGIIARLNDLREDLNSMQKLCYTLNFRPNV
nr:MAG TPA: hypothetical protein [Caudoviricetes sp.]